MKIIVGLGNPGLKYKNTRHNLGFIALDYLKNNFSNTIPFSEFVFDNYSNAKISQGNINSEKVLLVKPQTYMNNSGICLKKLVDYYKLSPENDLIIIYDDIDLSLGIVKTSGHGAGGHNGMQSIIDNLKTNNIHRIRIGILDKNKEDIKDTASYVLSKLTIPEDISIKIFKEINTALIEYFNK